MPSLYGHRLARTPRHSGPAPSAPDHGPTATPRLEWLTRPALLILMFWDPDHKPGHAQRGAFSDGLDRHKTIPRNRQSAKPPIYRAITVPPAGFEPATLGLKDARMQGKRGRYGRFFLVSAGWSGSELPSSGHISGHECGARPG